MKTMILLAILAGTCLGGVVIGDAEVSGCDPFCGN